MKKVIIFIKYTPLTQKVYEDFCMEDLANAGYHVEYWDVTQLFSFSLNSFENYSSNRISNRRIKDYGELSLLAKQMNNSFYISLMTPGLNQIRLLRVLSNNDSVISFWGPAPVFYKRNPVINRIRRITWSKVKWLMNHLVCRIFFRLLVKQNYDYYFNVGSMGFQALGSIDEKSKNTIKKLQVHSFDYNNYIFSQQSSNIVIDEPYILFIDQYYPFHPDMAICGVNHIPYEPYYEQLNNTFKMIEEKLNMKIIIAAHPKSLKYKDTDFFDGRRVFWGCTSDLTKKATLVITHDSTAISYAIMSHKPVLIITSSLIKKYYPVNYNNSINLSDEFGFTLVNMDNKETVHTLQSDNIYLNSNQVEKYNSFIYKYCTSSDLHKSNRELLLCYLRDVIK